MCVCACPLCVCVLCVSLVCVRAVRDLRHTATHIVCVCACVRVHVFFVCVRAVRVGICACVRARFMCINCTLNHCNTLQHTATHCSTLQHRMTCDVCVTCVCGSTVHEHVQDTTMPMCCSVFCSCCSETQITHTSYVIQFRSVLQCVAACRSVLQCVAVCCSVLQCVAVCCSVLQ